MIAALVLVLALQTSAPAEPLIGRATVIDGDTLEIHGRRVRLWGMDAPEGRQSCARDGRAYRCGTEAARHLDRLIGDRPVTCTPQGRPDRYGRMVARCEVTADCEPDDDCRTFRRDLGAWMVADGWALDDPRYSDGEHAEQQWDAEQARKGLWAGTFVTPKDWRKGHR